MWFRGACPVRPILYLGLVYLIHVHLTCGLASTTSGPGELGESGANRLDINSERENGLIVVDDPLVEISGSEEDVGEEENNAPDESTNRSHVAGAQTFTWRHHQDDHGLYAGRSLMTMASSKPQDHAAASEEKEDVAVNEEVEEDAAPSRRASQSSDKDARISFELAGDRDRQDGPLKTVDYAEKEWQLMFRAFDSAYDSISSSVLLEISKQTNLFEDVVSKLKGQCRRDIYYIRDSIKKHKLWALRMVDSNGKLPSGITYGRFSSPGDYEECLSVQVDDKLYRDVANNVAERHKFHGKYCLLDFRLPLPERPRNKLLSIHESVLNFTGTEIYRRHPKMIDSFSAYASVFYEVGYLHAFCLPSTCDVKDLTRALTKSLEGLYLIVNNTVDCEERPAGQSKPIRASQWISMTLMGLVFVNALGASLVHYLLPQGVGPGQAGGKAAGRGPSRERHQNQAKEESHGDQKMAGALHATLRKLTKLEEAKGGAGAGAETQTVVSQKGAPSLKQRLLSLAERNRIYSDCFSVQKNFERLTKPDPRGLTFVHYTRIVAMALTVITHTGALGTLQAITKPADASNSEQIFRDLIPQVLANAFTSIQIFFFMAGFMLVISTFPSIKRDRGHISFVEYAVKRAIRLMPGIAAAICLNFIWPLLVDGPMLSYFDRMIVEPCETNWWHTMGFISNFDHVEKMCLRHSYFSASDYQLHIMAFPLLILLHKRPGLSLFLAALLTVSGFVAQIIMILTKTVLPFMMVDYIDKEAFFNVVHYIHHPVWNHLSAFFYGFIVGYLVVRQIRVQLSPAAIKRVWLVTVPAGVLAIFAPYFWNHYKRPIHKWQMVLYVIFDRAILLTTCAWLAYATMVLARKPPAPKAKARPEPGPPETANPDRGAPVKRTPAGESAKPSVLLVTPDQRLRHSGDSSGSLASLPRQRSSPNLIYLQQQQQQQQQQQRPEWAHQLAAAGGGRLSRTTSSSNLATIMETSQAASELKGVGQTGWPADKRPAEGERAAQQPAAKARGPALVSNINTLCLVLSRLTFQLYLFNMVVLWIDVNHSKYYWFFSYYFIVFKAAAIYICSGLLAMVFFIVLESPSLTLYILWVKGRAAARAKSAASRARPSDGPMKVAEPSHPNQRDTVVAGGEPMELTSANTKPTLAFIDGQPASQAKTAQTDTPVVCEVSLAQDSSEGQTKM